jgi:hypothetical protein
MCFSTPKIPDAPTPPPSMASPAVLQARTRSRRRTGQMSGISSTIATSALGMTGVPVRNTAKTLLGE